MWYIIGFAILLVVIWLVAMRMFPHTITLKEGLIILGVQSVLLSAIVFGSLYGQGSDRQILNGQVTGKLSEEVSCEHSYECNCYYTTSCSGSGADRSCSQTRHCSTCYEHSYDVDWRVKSSVGDVLINRVDRQGLDEPPRFSSVLVGEPFAKEGNYYNYIKASPFSIFNKSTLDSKVVVPPYISVYDYYRINRVVDFGNGFKHDGTLNTLLNESLKTLGSTKKVNVVVVLHNKGQSFSEALKAKHLGGKINDVYVVLDITKEGVFNDVDIFSWSKSDMVNVSLRDALLDIGEYDAVEMNEIIKENISKYYIHRSVEEFKYLDDEVEIPKWAVWALMIIGLLFPFVGAFVAHKHEIA